MFKPNYEPITLIVDGNHALHRAMHQSSYRELSNSRGMPTGMIYGFCSILKGIVNKLGASSVIVVFDGGHSKRRMSLYEDYKKREPDEEVHPDTGMTQAQYFNHQKSWVKSLLDKLGIINISVNGREGDDLIFQLAHMIRGKKIIISEDRDFCSLITDSIFLYRPIRGEMINNTNFKEATGCSTPKHFLYQKVIVGDGSDNIPQVCKGVGDTTVNRLLEKIKDVDLNPETIIKTARETEGSRYQKLALVGTAPIERNLGLIDIEREEFTTLELMEVEDKIKEVRTPDINMATKIMNALEFGHETQNSLLELSHQVNSFPTGDLIDETYITNRMAGSVSAVLG